MGLDWQAAATDVILLVSEKLTVSKERSAKSLCVRTYGCQMSQHDSEIIAGLLHKDNYVLVDDPGAADVVIFNTCCVREHAEQRLYGSVRQLKSLKVHKPDLIIAVGGCLAQKEGMGIVERLPHVDLVFGTHALYDLPHLLSEVARGNRPVVSTPDEPRRLASVAELACRRGRVKAWLSIMEGCDNYCAYCVVPYVRGPQRSKSPELVTGEAGALAARGYKEVTLLGQNVNSYGQDLSPPVSFARLLAMASTVDGLRRIRFTTSHPKDLSTELTEAMRDLDKVCEHIHLPLQSGSDSVLARMNRGYTAAEYLKKVERIRATVPDVAITTDIIVGFPGETEADFCATREMLDNVRFDGAYIFKYSQRPGTAAAKLNGELDEELIKDRHQELLDLQMQISRERIRSYHGKLVSVLAEDAFNKEVGMLVGRTRNHRVVAFRASDEMIGEEIPVRIVEAASWTLRGERVT